MGYTEIYARFSQQIVSGVLRPGDRVPAIRVLASELKVVRNTVEMAYEILTGEGYLVMPKEKTGRFSELGEITESGLPLLPQKILA